MATYTSNLRLTKPVDGDLLWGTTVNTGITDLVDTAITGLVSIVVAGSNYTLSTANGAVDEARRMILDVSGSPGAARSIICPTLSKMYVVRNGITGGYAVTLKTVAGTGVSVPNGTCMLLMCDGVNVVEAVTALTSPTIAGTLTVATASVGTNSTAAASTAFVQTAIAAVNAQTPATTVVIDGSLTITATAGQHIVCTNVAAVTITLPASPTIGHTVWITPGNGLTTNVVAMAASAEPIMGVAENMTIDNQYVTVELRYINITLGWRLV